MSRRLFGCPGSLRPGFKKPSFLCPAFWAQVTQRGDVVAHQRSTYAPMTPLRPKSGLKYVPCWITVSPAMCVTGNMASNMSLQRKERMGGEHGQYSRRRKRLLEGPRLGMKSRHGCVHSLIRGHYSPSARTTGLGLSLTLTHTDLNTPT